MKYQVNRITFEELPFSDDHRLYYYDAGHLIEKKPGLHNKNVDRYSLHDYLHLEIYDDVDLWYVSFEADDDKFLVSGDKLMVFSGMLFSGKNDCVYLYCLKNKKGIDCFSTHNYHLTHQDEYWLEYGGVTQCIVSHRYSCIIVFNFEALIACDVSGVRWKVDLTHSAARPNSATFSVIGSRVVIKIEPEQSPEYEEYDIHTGRRLLI